MVAEVEPAAVDHGMRPTVAVVAGERERAFFMVAVRRRLDERHDGVLVAEIQVPIRGNDRRRFGARPAILVPDYFPGLPFEADGEAVVVACAGVDVVAEADHAAVVVLKSGGVEKVLLLRLDGRTGHAPERRGGSAARGGERFLGAGEIGLERLHGGVGLRVFGRAAFRFFAHCAALREVGVERGEFLRQFGDLRLVLCWSGLRGGAGFRDLEQRRTRAVAGGAENVVVPRERRGDVRGAVRDSVVEPQQLSVARRHAHNSASEELHVLPHARGIANHRAGVARAVAAFAAEVRQLRFPNERAGLFVQRHERRVLSSGRDDDLLSIDQRRLAVVPARHHPAAEIALEIFPPHLAPALRLHAR